MADELSQKWSKMADSTQHIPLSVHMAGAVMKILSRFAFGDYFKDEKLLISFRKDYDLVYNPSLHCDICYGINCDISCEIFYGSTHDISCYVSCGLVSEIICHIGRELSCDINIHSHTHFVMLS